MLPKPMQYSNRLCYAREIEAQQRLHRHRLATMRPTSHTNSKGLLDMARPETMDMTHVKTKAKKLQVWTAGQASNPHFILLSIAVRRVGCE